MDSDQDVLRLLTISFGAATDHCWLVSRNNGTTCHTTVTGRLGPLHQILAEHSNTLWRCWNRPVKVALKLREKTRQNKKNQLSIGLPDHAGTTGHVYGQHYQQHWHREHWHWWHHWILLTWRQTQQTSHNTNRTQRTSNSTNAEYHPAAVPPTRLSADLLEITEPELAIYIQAASMEADYRQTSAPNNADSRHSTNHLKIC